MNEACARVARGGSLKQIRFALRALGISDWGHCALVSVSLISGIIGIIDWRYRYHGYHGSVSWIGCFGIGSSYIR